MFFILDKMKNSEQHFHLKGRQFSLLAIHCAPALLHIHVHNNEQLKLVTNDNEAAQGFKPTETGGKRVAFTRVARKWFSDLPGPATTAVT